MAWYKYPNFLAQQNGAEFDTIHHPGQNTPISGIYRCTGCGLSATFVADKTIPPQNHHQHPNASPISWQLIVKSHWK
ncbi:hypothetical protein [Mesorhizobium sp. B2-3-4]|uniref:hypothetical protein n=1 Tax=Mesorhizobium sp. B2-3-4 TaxID=2589959 RepID=UPI00112EBE21|nr:hypothetical protein [Mesorhizobium sp. B2-3-4]TPM39594.1 hypothetical protein FJ967_08920 [Mesorhizobium sp. B2-3-4]